jgi:6-pyruvoyltetrahydropterin/6-carboxytetrahydropterin synthase
MYELIVHTGFSAAHRLREYQGDCENLHGHNWKLDVVLGADKLDRLGMVCDFRVVKQHLAMVTDKLDHKYLNELPDFATENPTTENVARFVCRELAKLLPAGVRVARVTAWESDGCGATYFNEPSRP